MRSRCSSRSLEGGAGGAADAAAEPGAELAVRALASVAEAAAPASAAEASSAASLLCSSTSAKSCGPSGNHCRDPSVRSTKRYGAQRPLPMPNRRENRSSTAAMTTRTDAEPSACRASSSANKRAARLRSSSKRLRLLAKRSSTRSPSSAADEEELLVGGEAVVPLGDAAKTEAEARARAGEARMASSFCASDTPVPGMCGGVRMPGRNAWTRKFTERFPAV